uniref:Putative ovule protein n=1 Tax=Solanum chacoense TaxID=4108 RepID=A0A0V0HCN5_SOLCH
MILVRHTFKFWQVHSENVRDHCRSASEQVNGKYDSVLSFWRINIHNFHATITMLLHYLIRTKHSPGKKCRY